MPQATPSQYPRSDRAHCNLRNVLLASFVSLFFQYPRSDRAHCNSREAPPRGARSALSVSSVGSSPLQHLHKRGFWGTSVLSVSSVGSSPLQRNAGLRAVAPDGSFSILGRIEPTATSGGRSGLLRPGGSFSILGRIEPTATPPQHVLRRGSSLFQYPRSDRAHCNPRPLRRGFSAEELFQYPRSDRAHCNHSPARPITMTATTFSILGRIEPTATRLARRVLGGEAALSVSSVGSSPLQLEVTAFLQVFCVAFSILGRIEPTATPTPSSASSWRFPLSVSSVGSSPLQLPLGRLGDAQIDDLSVSSVGSSPLQPHLDC